MRKLFVLALLVLSSMAMNAFDSVVDYNVVPMPQSVELTNKTPFVLSNNALISYTEGNEEMERNAHFLQSYLKEAQDMQLLLTTNEKNAAIKLVLDSKVVGDEAYELTVDPKGVTIRGSKPAGVFYGIQTLRKSLSADEVTDIILPTVVIKDAPRFGYRGLMLDTSRHFFSKEFLKEFIDILALHNMNRFHWHLTDDQGWRIEIKKHPLLTAIGSQRKSTVIGHNSQVKDGRPYGGYYTQEDAREIVEYARQHYVTVIPEIDMPGHQKAALAAYPELGCTGGPYEVGGNWGVYLDVFCLGNDKVYTLCEDVLTELMDIFPSEYIHIGGDESPNERWKECPKCKALMERTGTNAKTVQGYFTNRIEKFINSKGRRIIGWDEILDGDINQSATIMSWRGAEPGLKAARKGHDVIMTPTTYCYFDYYQADKNKYDEPTLIGGNLPVETVYSMKSVPDDMTEEEGKHILGVQANLWTEYIDNAPLAEYQLLPRAAALCEEQWCKQKGTYEDFLPRLTNLTELYRAYDYEYGKHLWPEQILPPDTDW